MLLFCSIAVAYSIFLSLTYLLNVKTAVEYLPYSPCMRFSLRWNNTSSQKGWPLIETTYFVIERILSTVTFILLHGRVDKVSGLWFVYSEFESCIGFFCCYLLNWLYIHFYPQSETAKCLLIWLVYRLFTLNLSLSNN